MLGFQYVRMLKTYMSSLHRFLVIIHFICMQNKGSNIESIMAIYIPNSSKCIQTGACGKTIIQYMFTNDCSFRLQVACRRRNTSVVSARLPGNTGTAWTRTI